MKLTSRQRAFFGTFGYLVVRQLLSPSRVERVIEAFEWSIQTWGGGEGHDGSKRTMFGGAIEHAPELCALLDHPGIVDLIGGVAGDDFNYCGGDGNYYIGDTQWHPDDNWGRPFATKTTFYLDELRRDSGCLRVIPGSHRADHFVRADEINPSNSEELFGVPPEEFPGSVALETDPGDVVIFDHDLFHASFGGGSRRRMFVMNCTRHARTASDMKLFRKYVMAHSPGANNIDTSSGMFFPTIIDTANESRMDHLRQPMEIHDDMYPQFARSQGAREPHRGTVR